MGAVGPAVRLGERCGGRHLAAEPDRRVLLERELAQVKELLGITIHKLMLRQRACFSPSLVGCGLVTALPTKG